MSIITKINQLDFDKKYSYADYLQWRLDEFVELVKGRVLKMSPAPLRLHQVVAGRIFADLEQYLRKKSCNVYIAPFDVRFPRVKDGSDEQIFTVVQPDICIVCDETKLDDRGCVGAPDTIIEILSRGNIDRDVNQKFKLYQEFGVPEYWIVAPGEKTITAYQLDAAGKYQLSGEYDQDGPIPIASLKDFTLKWEDIFND